jgi:2-haloacid dehalogenase
LVRNVVFDIGGVLLQWDPRHLYRRLIADPATLEWFLSEVCTLEWNSRLDAGVPFDVACDELATSFPAQAELIHAWKRQDEMIAGEVPGTADIVLGLREAGTALYLLTNMPAGVFRARRARFEVLRLFDGAVVSGEEGVLKPSPEMFALLTGRFGLEPKDSLFIDDSEINVAGARSAGFHAHHFVDAPSLSAALVGHGLLPGP